MLHWLSNPGIAAGAAVNLSACNNIPRSILQASVQLLTISPTVRRSQHLRTRLGPDFP
jgi:hypothetical protein